MAQENSKAKESLAKWSILYTKSHFGNHNKLLVPDNPGAEPKELHKPSPSPELCPHHLHPNHPWGGKPEPLTQPICWGLGGHNNPVQVHAQRWGDPRGPGCGSELQKDPKYHKMLTGPMPCNHRKSHFKIIFWGQLGTVPEFDRVSSRNT